MLGLGGGGFLLPPKVVILPLKGSGRLGGVLFTARVADKGALGRWGGSLLALGLAVEEGLAWTVLGTFRCRTFCSSNTCLVPPSVASLEFRLGLDHDVDLVF